MTPIPFFTGDITLNVHSATSPAHVGKRVAIETFAGGEPVSLYQDEQNKEYYCRKQDGRFIKGAEA